MGRSRSVLLRYPARQFLLLSQGNIRSSYRFIGVLFRRPGNRYLMICGYSVGNKDPFIDGSGKGNTQSSNVGRAQAPVTPSYEARNGANANGLVPVGISILGAGGMVSKVFFPVLLGTLSRTSAVARFIHGNTTRVNRGYSLPVAVSFLRALDCTVISGEQGKRVLFQLGGVPLVVPHRAGRHWVSKEN